MTKVSGFHERSHGGLLYYVGLGGYYWSSFPLNANSGCGMHCSAANMFPVYSDFNMCGFVLRPVKEN